MIFPVYLFPIFVRTSCPSAFNEEILDFREFNPCLAKTIFFIQWKVNCSEFLYRLLYLNAIISMQIKCFSLVECKICLEKKM